MNEHQLRAKLRNRLKGSTYRKLAAELGVTSAWLHRAINGGPLGTKLALALGYRPTIKYVKEESGHD